MPHRNRQARARGQFGNRSRSFTFQNLPVEVRGHRVDDLVAIRAAATWRSRAAAGARRARRRAASHLCPGLTTMQASGRSLHFSSGSRSPRPRRSPDAPSARSRGRPSEIHSPPDLIRSLVRSVMRTKPCGVDRRDVAGAQPAVVGELVGARAARCSSAPVMNGPRTWISPIALAVPRRIACRRRRRMRTSTSGAGTPAIARERDSARRSQRPAARRDATTRRQRRGLGHAPALQHARRRAGRSARISASGTAEPPTIDAHASAAASGPAARPDCSSAAGSGRSRSSARRARRRRLGLDQVEQVVAA